MRRRRQLRAVALDAASVSLFAVSAALLLARLDHVPPLAWWPLNALALAPLLWLTTLAAREFGLELASSAWLSFALSGVAAAFVTNQLHRWAHAERAPRAVRWLQRRRWILAPEEHARHHAGAHDCAYCVTTGWLNAPLDRLGVFRALEAALRERAPKRARP